MREHAVGATDERDASARLELRGPADRRVHFLEGRPLGGGDTIEVLLAGGYWLRGRYAWSGIEARWPGLRIELGGLAPPRDEDDDGRTPAAVMALHPDAIVRRPPP